MTKIRDLRHPLAAALAFLFAIAPSAGASTPREDLACGYVRLRAGQLRDALPPLFRAASAGDPYAQNILALLLYRGQGLARNPEQAVEWWEKAAALNLPEAQYNLALCYARGEGTSRDPEKAVYWWKLAAEQGMADAAYNLALCYRHGFGVDRNPQQEQLYLKLARPPRPVTAAADASKA